MAPPRVSLQRPYIYLKEAQTQQYFCPSLPESCLEVNKAGMNRANSCSSPAECIRWAQERGKMPVGFSWIIDSFSGHKNWNWGWWSQLHAGILPLIHTGIPLWGGRDPPLPGRQGKGKLPESPFAPATLGRGVWTIFSRAQYTLPTSSTWTLWPSDLDPGVWGVSRCRETHHQVPSPDSSCHLSRPPPERNPSEGLSHPTASFLRPEKKEPHFKFKLGVR